MTRAVRWRVCRRCVNSTSSRWWHATRAGKLTGDGALIEFGSAVEALAAAIEFHQVMSEANREEPADDALVFRIGLHLGNVIVDGDDLYGDGVNIAARPARRWHREMITGR